MKPNPSVEENASAGPDKSYRWHAIEDLPADWQKLHKQELDVVHEQWKREKSILKDPKKLQELTERLATWWAIETGIIEQLYMVDRGITLSLLELGLGAIETLHLTGALSRDAVLLIQDQKSALDFVFDFVANRRELTDSYIKELHQALTKNQSSTDAVDPFGKRLKMALLKGAWKRQPNNPLRPNGAVHEYCPPEFVQDEIDRLVTWHRVHRELRLPADVEAAWLHHRFTQIHPFQDGNGRVARALATMVYLREDYLPLVIKDQEHKENYLEGLEAADHGDLAPLVDLFAKIQEEDLTWAIEQLRSIRGEGIPRIATSAAERAKLLQEQVEQKIISLTERLLEIAANRLEEIQGELKLEFEKQHITLEAWVGRSEPDKEHWWSFQVVEVAKAHGYWANLSGLRRWVQLRLRLPGLSHIQTNIVISFHQKGPIPGLMVADAFMSESPIGGPAEPESGQEVGKVTDQPFSYSADHREVEEKFREWLDKVMEEALDRWQARI